MRSAMNTQEFKNDPVGAYLVGSAWVYWCARPDLFGLALWGRPSEDDVNALITALRVELAPGVVPHASLVDASRLEGVDGGAFQALNQYVGENHDLLARRVTRLALVRSSGMAGAVTAGFYEVTAPPYPVSLFDDLDTALDWIEGEKNPELVQAIGRIYEAVSEVDPVVARLRPLIRAQLTDLNVSAIAHGLGLSERTLQRRLKNAGTTFQREAGIVRVTEAKHRMLDSDASLTRIALDLGFSSLQHFSTLFLRATGEQPSAWRKERR